MTLPIISIIIPTLNQSNQLNRIREQLSQSTTPLEVIIVAEKSQARHLRKRYPQEQLVFTQSSGRGFAMLKGVRESKGMYILFLHDDTILPNNWDQLILGVFENPSVSGGGFSLTFNRDNQLLRCLIRSSDFWFRITGELWGDRALFVRRDVIRRNLKVLNVPIMEDVRLSGLMRREGVTVMLKEKVITDATGFNKNGILSHTCTILFCRMLQFIGFSADRIYRIYYR